MMSHLQKLYKIRFNSSEIEKNNRIWKVLCSDFFRKYIPKQSIILDVGCGHGHFINNIQAHKKFALDINPDSSMYLKDDIHFINEDINSVQENKNHRFDIVFISNFLEHLSSKTEIENVLEKVWKVLSPNGKLIILGPNIKYLAGSYWDFYDHHIPLTHNSICEVLKLKGFRIDCCLNKFLPYTTKGKLPVHPILVKIYLRIPWLWKIFGKQFFVIGQKVENETQEL